LIRACIRDFEGQRRHLEKRIAEGDTSPALLRRAAWFAAAAGDNPQADAYLARARLQTADQGEAWFATGLLRTARDEYEAARQAFASAARALLPPGDDRRARMAAIERWNPAENRYGMFGIFYADFSHDFCCFLFPRQVRPAERLHYDHCVARACVFLRPQTPMAALLETDRALNGCSPWYHVNMGHFHWLEGRRDEADASYLAAKQAALDNRITPYHFNCGTMVWLPREQAEPLVRSPASGGQISTHGWDCHFGSSGPRPEIAIIVGLDRRYFQFLPKFVLMAVAAHVASGSGIPAAVHCHLADGSDEQVAFLEQAADWIRREGPEFRLTYSLSRSPVQDPSYYTCLRFMVLQRVMAELGCGCIAMDVDAAIEPDFFGYVRHVTQFGAGLRMYTFDRNTGKQFGGEPWSIGAHPTFVAPTETGRAFAAFLHNYVCAAYDAGLPTNWTIDQCAIAQGYELILRKDPDFRVLNFAHYHKIAALPHEFGGKAAFLQAGGLVTADNFFEHVAVCTRS
jgi:tetratricopeptide (TPR) repeat protein